MRRRKWARRVARKRSCRQGMWVVKKALAGPCEASPRSFLWVTPEVIESDMIGRRVPLAALWKTDSREHTKGEGLPFVELRPPPHRYTLVRGVFPGRIPWRVVLVLFLLLYQNTTDQEIYRKSLSWLTALQARKPRGRALVLLQLMVEGRGAAGLVWKVHKRRLVS